MALRLAFSRCCAAPPRRFLSTSLPRSLATGLEQSMASASTSQPSTSHATPPPSAATTSSANVAGAKPARAKPRQKKAALTILPGALEKLKALQTGPNPRMIRVGVKNKGCAGMSYALDYVDKADKWDEVVDQDGVAVVIDSKALFSVIGSEMDWEEGRVESRFVFNNPNVKSECGCKESFSL